MELIIITNDNNYHITITNHIFIGYSKNSVRMHLQYNIETLQH